jgi:hypothetical protein
MRILVCATPLDSFTLQLLQRTNTLEKKLTLNKFTILKITSEATNKPNGNVYHKNMIIIVISKDTTPKHLFCQSPYLITALIFYLNFNHQLNYTLIKFCLNN